MRPAPALLLAALAVAAAACGREERVRRIEVVPVSNVVEKARPQQRRVAPQPTPTPRARPISGPARGYGADEPYAAE